MYERLAQLVGALKRVGEPVTLLLSHRAAALPGLAARLVEASARPTLVGLPPAASGSGALAESERDPGSGRGAALRHASAACERRPQLADVGRRSPPAHGRVRSPAPAARADGADAPAPRGPGLSRSRTSPSCWASPSAGGRAASSLPARRPGSRDVTARVCSTRAAASSSRTTARYGSSSTTSASTGRAELAAGDRLRLGSPGDRAAADPLVEPEMRRRGDERLQPVVPRRHDLRLRCRRPVLHGHQRHRRAARRRA